MLKHADANQIKEYPPATEVTDPLGMEPCAPSNARNSFRRHWRERNRQITVSEVLTIMTSIGLSHV